MNWLDCAGAPGSGKSSLCYPIWSDRSVTWDHKPPPIQWRLFLDEITALCGLVQDHPSYQAVLRMNDRSAKKMASVYRMSDTPPNSWELGIAPWCFIQTGFVQRILGFGWRLHQMDRDINLIRKALWLMPVSVGVAFLEADLETLLARNKAREQVPETAHENRGFQCPHILACMPLAKQVLRERGVPVIEIDVQNQSIDDARAELVAFSQREPIHSNIEADHDRYCSPPPWWR